MASTFQQRARLRKGIYAGLMLLLFTGSYFIRDRVILAQAENLGLREETKGEVELTGSAVRLSLTGSRGLAVCFLWLAVQDKQRRHEWNEMEMLVASVAKLQPHFVSPWLYQSWNMSFNVSAECDSPYDKYFYICRGIQLLAEGEKRNQGSKKGNLEFPGIPDLRFHLAFYYQLKIGKSDENRTLRSFCQMSCMPESEREPDDQETGLEPKDETGRPRLNLERFRTFCAKHPRLVRRLREELGCATPQQVVSFLRRHKNIPSRYGKDMKLKENALDRFPVLPPSGIPGEPSDDDKGQGSTLGDDFDNFAASRAWYRYAMLPLPPLDPYLGAFGWNWDKRKYRLPRMTHYIFRQYPALAQSNIALQLAQEGWFDHRGWLIEAKGDKPWFTRTAENGKKLEEKVLVGNSDKYSSQRAWEKTLEAFTDFGVRTQLRMPDAHDEWITQLLRGVGGAVAEGLEGPPLGLQVLKQQVGQPDELALKFMELLDKSEWARSELERTAGKIAPKQRSARIAESQRATAIIGQVHTYRSLTGYKQHYYQAEGERTDAAISARKHYFNAKEYEETYGNRRKSVEELKKWLDEWKDLLERKPGFRSCDEIQEQSYHRQLVYFHRFQQFQKTQLQDLFLEVAGYVPSRVPLPIHFWLKHPFQDPRDPDKPMWEEWQREQIARIIPAFTMLGREGPFSPRGPFDGLYPDGTPFIPLFVVIPEREKWMKVKLRSEGPPADPLGMGRPEGDPPPQPPGE